MAEGTAWFDNICQIRKSTLEERAQLMKHIGIVHLNEGARRFYLNAMRYCLHELDREYTPSMDAIANAIINILPTFQEKRLRTFYR